MGREKELQALLQALEGLSQGRSRIITLIGDAGLGKTRLLEEARPGLPHLPIDRFAGWRAARDVIRDDPALRTVCSAPAPGMRAA